VKPVTGPHRHSMQKEVGLVGARRPHGFVELCLLVGQM
jgi:hypothetical protein